MWLTTRLDWVFMLTCSLLVLFCLFLIFSPLGRVRLGGVQAVPFSNWVGRTDSYFIHDWSAFHLAWWLAWSPFLGSFIARISKGRIVREFLCCVLILPMLLVLLCMSVFGGTAIASGLPFALILIGMAFCTWLALRKEA